MRKKRATIILLIIFLIGLSLLLYPSFSDWWNSFHQSRAVASYDDAIKNLDEEDYKAIWEAAWNYNQSLTRRSNQFSLTAEQQTEYESLLNFAGNGMIGYIDIPNLDQRMPIYHGTSEGVLQIAIGHLEWTSLPVGGMNSHCVVSGHRGLPSAKLFTDLDKMQEGDVFHLRIMDEVLTYQVTGINVVLPEETEELTIQAGKDMCTLVTCTPYGINTHRLLVHGTRIETIDTPKEVTITADGFQLEPVVVAPVVASPMLIVLLINLMIPKKRRR